MEKTFDDMLTRYNKLKAVLEKAVKVGQHTPFCKYSSSSSVFFYQVIFCIKESDYRKCSEMIRMWRNSSL